MYLCICVRAAAHRHRLVIVMFLVVVIVIVVVIAVTIAIFSEFCKCPMHIAVIISVQIIEIFIHSSLQLWLRSRRPLLRLAVSLTKPPPGMITVRPLRLRLAVSVTKLP